MTSCKKLGPVQQTLNIIKNIDKEVFESHLITLYPEECEGSQLPKYLPHVNHHFVPTGKKAILLGKDRRLRSVIEEIDPGVIHSVGVFPNFAISRMKKWKQVTTLRNYLYDDYPAKFGKIKGYLLVWLQLYAMKRTYKTVTCSESLSAIYKEHLGLHFDYIRNGVDVEQYYIPPTEEKTAMRKKLGLTEDCFVFVYSGQMIERKNVGFLLEAYFNKYKKTDTCLLLLGGGPLLESYKQKYCQEKNIIFFGHVSNVNDYLKACDAYVSTSLSEGLPNGVLEAMATGLPVVLSDIPQHKEIFEANQNIGFLYEIGNANGFAKCLEEVRIQADEMGHAAYQTAHEYFSASKMSKQYQDLYLRICREKIK